jgi:site-specific DNA-cytosine methylase
VINARTRELSEIRHFHFYCGLGGFAKGMNEGSTARIGPLKADFRCIGGIDSGKAECEDFKKLAGVPATCLDLFSREQYEAFHGKEPPFEWTEATIQDVRDAAGGESPNVVCISAPCKGFSGLLSESLSKSRRYQALNELALRGLMLSLEAWSDDPPEFYLFENVPRIQTRGRDLLDQIITMLKHYGYAARETTHDCGELAEGGMAESRKRFLLVARHEAKIPVMLFEPQKHPLRAVGSVLGRMTLPGDQRSGAMHRVPSLNWKTWTRLAFVTAGSDWRSLNELAVEEGFLRDFAMVQGRVAHTASDPRFNESEKWNHGHAYGVLRWGEAANTIGGQQSPGQGYYSVQDPRPTRAKPFRNVFRVVRWDEVGKSVTGGGHPTSGGISVADPRSQMVRAATADFVRNHHYGVVPWASSMGAVTGRLNYDNGAGNVADPRNSHAQESNSSKLTRAGQIGLALEDSGCDRPQIHAAPAADKAHSAPRRDAGMDGAVQSIPALDRGTLPQPDERLVCRIESFDKTWHRPFTTLELAALQGLIDPEEHIELHGLSDRDWRERIGNAVPPPAARAMAGVIGTAILLARTGETFVLGMTPVWVRDVAVAISVAGRLQ